MIKYKHIPNIKCLHNKIKILWDSKLLPIPIDKFNLDFNNYFDLKDKIYLFWLTLSPKLSTEVIKLILSRNKIETIRISTSKYNTIDELNLEIQRIKSIICDTKISIAIDISGPKVRICCLEMFSGEEYLNILKNELVVFVPIRGLDLLILDEELKDFIIVPYMGMIPDILTAKYLFVSDGWSQFKILENINGILKCRALHDCVINNYRGIDMMGMYDNINFLTDATKIYIENLISRGILDEVKWLCVSFCNKAIDLHNVRSLQLPSTIQIMAKIETVTGLNNRMEIIETSDGVMIARGDLAVQLALHDIDIIYAEDLIRTSCNKMNKVCIIATRVADSLDGIKDQLSVEELNRLQHELSVNEITYLLLTNETLETDSAYYNYQIISKALENMTK